MGEFPFNAFVGYQVVRFLCERRTNDNRQAQYNQQDEPLRYD
jgi:hypothetical protein